MVMELIDFSVDRTVVGKEPDLGCHTGREVVDMTEKEDQTEDCALRNPRLHRDLVRGLAFQNNLILRWVRKVVSQVCSGPLTP